MAEQDFILLPGGVHAWNPLRADLGAVPEKVIESRSADFLYHPLETPGWMRVVTDDMKVEGDIPTHGLRMVAVTAEKLDEMFRKELPGPPRRYIYKIRVFNRREDFCRYASNCGAAGALSLYNPRTNEVGVHFVDYEDGENFLETFSHEMVHAYMDIVFGVTEPLFFAEGMAEYFSRVRWTSQGFRPTGKNWKAAMHLQEETMMTLDSILKAKREDLYGVDFPQYYAQCWAFVHFLLHKHPDIVQAFLERRFLPDKWSNLEPQYKAYVKKLMGF